MARIARVVAPDVPHHITQRGNRRLMAEWCHRERVRVWAYCLMPNHVHLVAVSENERGLARAVGEAHQRYTRLVNEREGWSGYLWQGRFSSCPLDEKHLLAAVRYVEQNPVRAGLVRKAWKYCWSSAAAHVQGQDDLLVSVEPMLERVPDWRAYLAEETGSFEAEQLKRHIRTGRPLGEPEFIERLERRLHRP